MSWAVLMLALAAQAEQPEEQTWVTLVVADTSKPAREFSRDLSRAVSAALTPVGAHFVPPPDTPLSEVQLALGCTKLDEACAASMGESVGARIVVVVTLGRAPARSVTYSMVDVDKRKRARVRTVSVARFDMLGAQAVAAALAGDFGAPGVLTVKSQPPGAMVRVDGEVAGETPLALSGSLADGPHAVVLRFPDGTEVNQTAVLRAGEEATVEVSLTAGAQPEVEDGPAVGALLGWSMVGASLVAALGGGALGLLAALAQDRYSAERVVDGVTVQEIDRAEAKAVAQEIEGYVLGAEVAFGASLALALGGAVAFALSDE